MRKATVEDIDFILNVRNKEYIRNVSYTTKLLTKEEHYKFWGENYNYYWIIQTQEKLPIGFIRVKDNEVSIALLKDYWNKGYCTNALKEVITMFPELKAEVKINNMQGLCFFIKNGFKPEGFILKRREYARI